MRTSESVVVPVPPAEVFPYVVDLAAYPSWLRLVHAAEPVGDSPASAWSVELRARVGPLARSKQLRMERTMLVPDEVVVFERAEVDGRQHARWELRAELRSNDDHGTVLTMHLAYDGALWTGGLMERVLDEEIRRARAGLLQLVSGEPTH